MIGPSEVKVPSVTVIEQERTVAGQLDEILSSYQGANEDLIPILQHVQRVLGYLPETAMKRIARFLKLPESTVFGVGTFYAQFKLAPSGRNSVTVCRGTACHVRGGARILREVERHLGIKSGESTPDLEYCLETVACIGACALAPTMLVSNNTYGQMTPKKATEILEQLGRQR